jgi:hypothetical protein
MEHSGHAIDDAMKPDRMSGLSLSAGDTDEGLAMSGAGGVGSQPVGAAIIV